MRIIKNDPSIFSYKDTQGFRKEENQKLKVKVIDDFIYHSEIEFDYSSIDLLDLFTGSHPSVFLPRIQKMNWKFDRDLTLNKVSFKEGFKQIIKKITGGYIIGEYKNY